jgi:hypothetical protein
VRLWVLAMTSSARVSCRSPWRLSRCLAVPRARAQRERLRDRPGERGEILRHSLAANDAGVAEWMAGLPGLVLVAYEAGPTGFGLARLLTAAGVDCVIAAPSKLQRPSGDRFRCWGRQSIRPGWPCWDRYPRWVPGRVEEAARDLASAREDVRVDLMTANEASLEAAELTGNTHARRLLVEAAYLHRRPYNNASRDLRTRWDMAHEASRVGGHQGTYRLHRKWDHFEAGLKRRVVANVAVARELANWCWSLAAQIQQKQPWTDE